MFSQVEHQVLQAHHIFIKKILTFRTWYLESFLWYLVSFLISLLFHISGGQNPSIGSGFSNSSKMNLFGGKPNENDSDNDSFYGSKGFPQPRAERDVSVLVIHIIYLLMSRAYKAQDRLLCRIFVSLSLFLQPLQFQWRLIENIDTVCLKLHNVDS